MAFIDVTRTQRPAGLSGADLLRSEESRMPYRSVRLAVIAVSAGIGHQFAGWSGALGVTVLALIAVALLSPLMPDRRTRSGVTQSPHAPRAGHEPRLWSDGDAFGQR